MCQPQKEYNTIGCCGIDCGLCPRYYTEGDSRCPGCGAADFSEKHPSCGFLTCCVQKHGVEVCVFCSEYPCRRFNAEREGFDSFVTHQKVFVNQELIKSEGIEIFLSQQQERMTILQYLLDNVNDGRAKSFYCLCCALLPLDVLSEQVVILRMKSEFMNRKELNKLAKMLMQEQAEDLEINLTLRKQQ